MGETVVAHLSASNAMYTDSVSSWLRVHGKAVRPQLDKRQLNALRECFDIIDTDGTGMITAGELCSVFTASPSPVAMHQCFTVELTDIVFQAPHVLYVASKCIRVISTLKSAKAFLQALGDHVSLEAVARVLDTINYHGSDGIAFPDFIAIMTTDSQDLHSGQRRGKADVTTAYNIAIMARAYRQLKPFSAGTSA